MPPLIFTSPAQFAAVNAVLLLAQIIYVAFGFGSGLIAVWPSASRRRRAA